MFLYSVISKSILLNPPTPNNEKILIHISNFRKVKRVEDVIKVFGNELQEELDILKYDKLIDSHQSVSIYCYSWYLDAVSDNWGALVKGDYKVVFPVIYTVKLGQKIMYQPFFTREVSLFPESDELTLFLNEIPKSFKKVDFGYNKAISFHNYEIKEVVNQELSLAVTYEDIYKNYSKNTKRLIKKAIKSDSIIEESEDVDSFIQFFKFSSCMN